VFRINQITIKSVFLLAALIGSQNLYAEIFKYEDSRGNLYFTDRPMKGKAYRLLWRSGPDRSSGRSRINTSATDKNRKLYSSLIDEVARQANLRPALLHAVVRAESSYDPKALSRKGAMGLMQLMPDTAKRFGVSDSWDPEQNLRAGARYLSELLDMFGNDLQLALAAYNAGENAVIKYGNQIPPYPETQQYVTKVQDFFQEHSQSGS
jgi:soluble lytic murein transglycosylase-like protein